MSGFLPINLFRTEKGGGFTIYVTRSLDTFKSINNNEEYISWRFGEKVGDNDLPDVNIDITNEEHLSIISKKYKEDREVNLKKSAHLAITEYKMKHVE